MTEQMGEQLSKLDQGDSIAITVDGICYNGEVTDTNRHMCELNAGFMESGGIAIYVELSSETLMRQDTPTEHLLITATEDVPQAWDNPVAMMYDRTEDETIAELGKVTEIGFEDRSVN